MPKSELSLETVLQAHARLAGHVVRTPSQVSSRLSEIAGMEVTLKHDYLQATGAFKERGARNALATLSREQQRRGVIAASAGNHALGLARHGAALGVPVTVVMPTGAPKVKVERCRAYGATVVLGGENFDAAYAAALNLAAEKGLHLVHPFDDVQVAAGQGTLGVELAEDLDRLEAVVLPVGGGGLLAGAATAIKALRPEVRVIAVEPIHAPKLTTALAAGRPKAGPLHRTLADGLGVAQLGNLAFHAAMPLVDHVFTVSEEEMGDALWQLHATEHIQAEGAGAAALALVLSGRLRHLGVTRVACPVTGGNIDAHVHRRVCDEAARRHAMAA